MYIALSALRAWDVVLKHVDVDKIIIQMDYL